MPDYIPNLSGRIDSITEQAIRNLYLLVYKIQRMVIGIQGQTPVLDFPRISKELGVSGSAPLNVTGLLGTLPNVGPGPGAYTVGLRLTGGGTDGVITIDAQGRITAIQQAT